MTYAKRVDENQPKIVAFLVAAGAMVFHLHRVGEGFPDLFVCYHGKLFIPEIKAPGGKLTPAEKKFKEELEYHGGEYWILTTIQDCMKMLESAE
jgi:hypothetical protein